MKTLEIIKEDEKVNLNSRIIDEVLKINKNEYSLPQSNGGEKNQNLWRRVEDGLPEINEVVLVCFKSSRDDSLIRAMAYGIDASGRWQWCTDLVYEEPDWYYRDDIEVTHWMPLPGIPQE